MKRILLSLLLVVVGCSSSQKKGNAPAERASFSIRKFETSTLPNGLKVLWIPDNALPYVSMQLLIKAGSAQDSSGKEGVAGFAGMMLEKGIPGKTATRIADELEQIGGSFSVNVEPDYTLVTASSLSFSRDQILKQFSEVVMTPTFPATEVERGRKMILASMQKIADRPQEFTEFLMPKFMYGSHPYGHEAAGTPSAIHLMKRADLINFYREFYRPDNAILAVVGQYDEAWKKQVMDTFSKWKSPSSKVKQLPPVPSWHGTEILLVDRADLNQAQIQIGFRGVPRAIPEFMELRAAIKILGESMGSRLFEEIREKRGLTYHIRAWFDPRLQTGPMGIYTFTRLDKIDETVTETLKVYRQFVAEGVTQDEVKNIKALMRGQFPRMFETPEALANQLLLLDYYGIGVDYLTNYFANLDTMSKESIDATIKKYFDADNLKILVYAPKAKAEASLKKLGAVEIKDYKEFLN